MQTALIFAGGLGTRLRAAVADRPKVLAEVNGRPFLAYLLDQIAATDAFGKVVLATGYMADAVEAAFGPSYGSLRLAYSREESPLGTGGALRLALPELDTDPVLVMNGDSYCHADLAGFLRARDARGAEAAMLLVEVDDVSRYGAVVSRDDGMLDSFVEKGGATGPGWINAGAYVLPRPVVERIPAGRPASLEKEVLPFLVGSGVLGVRAPGPFLDIGTPQSYAAAAAFFAGPACDDGPRD